MALTDLLTLEQKGAWRSFWRSIMFQIVPALAALLAAVAVYFTDPAWLQDAFGIPPIWAPMVASGLAAFVGTIIRALAPNTFGTRKEAR